MVPELEPEMITFTPGSGKPFSDSLTVPDIVDCVNASEGTNNISSSKLLIVVFINIF